MSHASLRDQKGWKGDGGRAGEREKGRSYGGYKNREIEVCVCVCVCVCAMEPLYKDTSELRTPLNRTPFPIPNTTLARTPH